MSIFLRTEKTYRLIRDYKNCCFWNHATNAGLKIRYVWNLGKNGVYPYYDSRLCDVTDESSGGVIRTLILSSTISTKCLLADKWRHDIRLLSGNHGHLKLTEKKTTKGNGNILVRLSRSFFYEKGNSEFGTMKKGNGKILQHPSKECIGIYR